jgi:ribonucleotide reductase alpha subunit
MENRPIGIGFQGLADVYCMLSLPFGSEKARELNKLIFENIYYGSVRMSIQLAKKYGKYKNYDGSPHSKGQLQFTMWDCKTTLDWKPLFEEMKIY